LAGGIPSQGVVVEGNKGVKYIPKRPGIYENGKKGQSPPLIDLKIAKNTIFYLKVLNKICSRDIF
jgi:hypothetical protein